MRYIRLLLEYDGTNYLGWQTQKSGGTVQDILCEKIFEITGDHVRLTGASRTDAGVHALGQVAVFGTDAKLPADVLMRALNAKLPHDIRVLNSEETSSEFHPRHQARRKSYFYLISECRVTSAFFPHYLWDIKTHLDLEKILLALPVLHGEHDFSSFMGAGCSSRNQVRTVYSIEVSRLSEILFMTASFRGNFVKIKIEANAFLRHMVRNIVGTLAEIGKGKMSPENLANLINKRERKLAGPTAPAKGLFLERIIY